MFGPNEYHKGTMMSVLARRFDDIKAGRVVQLFKSHRDGIADGDQRRDFIYVDDVVRVMMWLLATPQCQRPVQCRHRQGAQLQGPDSRGLCRARHHPRISHISTCPKQIRGSYQYFTQSDVDRLQRAGYNGGFTALEDAVGDLCRGFPRPRRSFPLTRNRTTDQMFDFDALSHAIRRQTVLCVGDLMLDEFVYGEVSRISPEAPAPVIAVQRSETNIGGAGNVARNIASLGARCIFVGLIGEDDAGARLKAALAQEGRIESVLVSRSRPADDAKGALRLRTFLHPHAARRLGTGAAGRPPISSRS